MIKYSIIIPHYNSPDLLIRCLKSIPVREDIQVIVVDDCSPEADTYLMKYAELSRPYLELYSTGTNGGGGKARNVGLQYAKGKWVLFADADDSFVNGYIDLLEKYYSTSADIVFFRARCFNEAGKEVRGIKEKLYELYEQRGDDRVFRYCYTEPWGKMLRRSLIVDNDIKFEEVIVANDFLFSVKTGYYSKEVIISHEYLYNYTIMKSSTSRGKMSEKKVVARLVENVKVQKFLDLHDVKTNYNLLSYVTRLKMFFPIITSTEKEVYKDMNYSIMLVLKDRIRLLIRRLLNSQTDLDSASRIFK